MTRTTLRRTIVGAAITVLLSTFALAPASAATAATIVWSDSIADSATYLYGQVPAAPTCTAVDDQVVAPTCVVSGYSALVGLHTLTATATSSEVIPTVTTATISYTVTATWTLKGFYKPVKMDGVWNKAKAGSTVPFKFKVYDGTTKLNGPGVVADFSAQQVSCTDPNATVGLAMPVASARKGFRLKYQAGAFHQNWKTPKAVKVAKHTKKPVATSACYQVTMTAVDGQALTALFRLK